MHSVPIQATKNNSSTASYRDKTYLIYFFS